MTLATVTSTAPLEVRRDKEKVSVPVSIWDKSLAYAVGDRVVVDNIEGRIRASAPVQEL